jgi:two-component system chemotaxis sensor kinase CheA
VSFDLSAYADAFQEECQEHLQRLDRGIPELTSPAADPAAVAALFRSAHTIKGGARMMGYAEIGELAYRVEAVLDGVRRGQVRAGSATIEGLLAGVAALRAQITGLAIEGGASPSTEAVMLRLEELIGANRADSSSGEGPAATAVVPFEPSAATPPTPDRPFADPAVIEGRLRRLLAVDFEPLDAATGPVTPAALASDLVAPTPGPSLVPPELETQEGLVGEEAPAPGSSIEVSAPAGVAAADGSVWVTADWLSRIASLAGELLVRQRDVHQCVEQARDIWGLVQAYDRAAASGQTEMAAQEWAALRAAIARWQRAAISADERTADLAQELHQEVGRLRP